MSRPAKTEKPHPIAYKARAGSKAVAEYLEREVTAGRVLGEQARMKK
jgi:hypothetical protein